ncbi:MAG: hypothetical protein ACYTDY_17345 [Planctomycetota bacterium]
MTRVRIHGEQYGGRFDPLMAVARVSVCDGEWTPLVTTFVPYTGWPRGKADWVDADVPPTSVPEKFFVVVEYFPTGTKGIYQSIDASAKEGSYSGTLDRLGSAKSDGGWMIRVRGTDKVPKVELPDPDATVLLEHGEGEPIGKLSAAGSGHAVRFASKKHPFLTSISLCGSRYGGLRDPDSTFFHVFVCDRKLEVLSRSAHSYGLFAPGELTWVDVPMPPVKVPRDFYVVVCFDPTQRQGVYVGKWSEKGGHSLLGYPGKGGKKLAKGEGWMIRATLAASAGKSELSPAAGPAEDSGLDASEVAEIREAVELAEKEEDVARANELIAKLAKTNEKDAAEMGRFDESDHFILRRVGVKDEAAASLLRLMEEAHRVLTEDFKFDRLSAIEGKKTHLHVTIGKGLETSLFTSPRSPDYSLVVLRGEESALTAPTRGGPHVVYGFLHELGHVLLGWEDSEHQWAHYLGSVLVDEVYAKLEKRTWWVPYDAPKIEGMARFLKDIEGASPGRGSAGKVGRLYYEVDQRFGRASIGPAVRWIKENREGKPFGVVRLYRLDDFRDALAAVTGKKEEVEALFGK